MQAPTGTTSSTAMRHLTVSVKLDPAVLSFFNEQQGVASEARAGTALLFPLPLQLRLPLRLSYAGLSPFGVRASDCG
jgi:hypothetical protein